jgi:hypothetical protein
VRDRWGVGARLHRLNKTTLDFLRGFVALGCRNDALDKAKNRSGAFSRALHPL